MVNWHFNSNVDALLLKNIISNWLAHTESHKFIYQRYQRTGMQHERVGAGKVLCTLLGYVLTKTLTKTRLNNPVKYKKLNCIPIRNTKHMFQGIFSHSPSCHYYAFWNDFPIPWNLKHVFKNTYVPLFNDL